MPVFEPQPEVVNEQPVEPRVTKPYYRSNVVDTQYTNRKSLILNTEGRPWRVNYYQQVLGEEDALSGLQERRVAARQQYIEIKDVILKVNTPTSTNQDDVTKTLNIDGSAYVVNGIIPNKGDHFVGDVGDGRQGVFQITNSERLSLLKDTVHQVSYKLVQYVDDNFDYQMDWKIVKTLYEYRDEMRYGSKTIIEEGEFSRLRDYDTVYHAMLAEFMQDFWSNEFHTLLVPGNPGTSTYDHFMTSFVTKLFDIHNAPHYRHLRVLNVNDDYNVMSCETVLDAIIKRQSSIIRHGVQKTGVGFARNFKFHPMFNSITYTGIQYVIYPSDTSKKIDYQLIDRTKASEVFYNENMPLKSQSLEQMYGESIVLPGFPESGLALIKPVLVDDYYIFSEAFYNGQAGLSALEYQVQAFIQGGVPDYKILDALIKQRQYWQVLEKYYYTPILLLLIYAYSRVL